jgi:hypothetical protein
MPPSKLSPAAMVCAALRTEVPLAAGMLPPEEPPAGRVAVPVVRGALEPLVLLPLSLLVRPLLLLELPELLLSLESLESELLELGLLELSLSLLSEELLVLLVRPLELLSLSELSESLLELLLSLSELLSSSSSELLLLLELLESLSLLELFLSLLELLSLEELSVETSLSPSHEAQGLLPSLLLSPAETALPWAHGLPPALPHCLRWLRALAPRARARTANVVYFILTEGWKDESC